MPVVAQGWLVACRFLGLTDCLSLPVNHQGGVCRRAHPPQTAYCRDRWMVAKQSRKRIRVSQQSSSGAPEPYSESFFNPLGDYDISILRKRIDTLAKQFDDRDRDARPHSTYQDPVRKLSEKWLRSAENGTRKIWRIYKALLAENANLPLGSEEQDAWVNAIVEEQAARSARSRRKAIENFHWACGW